MGKRGDVEERRLGGEAMGRSGNGGRGDGGRGDGEVIGGRGFGEHCYTYPTT